VITIICTVIITFVLIRILPGDPASVLLRNDATQAQIEAARHLWGFDKSIPEQFAIYLGNLVRGDVGNSFLFPTVQIKVTDLVFERLPNTIILALAALFVAVALAIPLGMITAIKAGSFLDNAVLTISLILTSFPNFFIGMLLIYFFALYLKILPTGGSGTPQNLILPTISLAIPFIASLTRVTRTEMGRILHSEYITTARSKGLASLMILYRHALRNALIPLVTIIGLRLGALLGGAVIVETLYRWPGIGSLMNDAIQSRDYPTVQFLVPLAALIFVLANFIVDILYGVLDPRVRKA
jgi:peptide/nickel transport system permease protein/oligopeptide transport system permease protein